MRTALAAFRTGRKARAAGVILGVAAACAGSLAAAQTSPSPIVPSDRSDQSPPRAPAPAAPVQPPRSPTRTPSIAPFELRNVQVDGSSLSPAALASAWRPFLGRMIDSAGLEQVTNAIADAYARSDVALYTLLVPNQDFAGGTLRIRVLEGYVDSVAVEGVSDKRVRALVSRMLAPLAAERPLRRSTLQRQVSLARDLPGLRTDVQFVAGGDEQAVRLRALVRSSPVQAAAAVNNRGTTSLGRTQMSGDLFLNNVLAAGGQTRLSIAVPTEISRFQYYAVSHSQWLGATGATLQVNAGYLRTRPAVAGLTGRAASAGFQLSYPLVRTYTTSVTATGGVDGLDAHSAYLSNTFTDDRSRAVRLGASAVRQTQKMRAGVSTAASWGFDALGAKTRTPGLTDLTFFKLNGRAELALEAADRWIVRLVGAGQWSDRRLPASEQFAVGGNEFGRGYEAAALVGDSGYAGSLELAYRLKPLPTPVRDGEIYGFVDGAKVRYNGRLGSSAIDADLGSFGGGVRGGVGEHLVLQLEAARAMANALPALDHGDWRLVFAARTAW